MSRFKLIQRSQIIYFTPLVILNFVIYTLFINKFVFEINGFKEDFMVIL